MSQDGLLSVVQYRVLLFPEHLPLLPGTVLFSRAARGSNELTVSCWHLPELSLFNSKRIQPRDKFVLCNSAVGEENGSSFAHMGLIWATVKPPQTSARFSLLAGEHQKATGTRANLIKGLVN